jgi:hypothetical protein
MKLIIITFLFLVTSKGAAQSCQKAQDNLGAIASSVCSNDSIEMVDKLKAQGFRCDSQNANISRRGVMCSGKLASYSQPVRIYVSPNYLKKPDSVINVHFHGHRLQGIDTFQTLGNDIKGHGDYGARLVESKSTDLLVIPESTGKCANYANELNTPGQTQEFFAALEKTTGLNKANYRLSAHSGGAKVVNKILLNQTLDGRVKSVGLFDAIYQEQTGVIKFLKTSSKNRAVVTYLENGTTQAKTGNFKAAVSGLKNQVQIFSVPQVKSSHMMIMNQGQFADFLAE